MMAIGSVSGTAFQGANKPAGNMQTDPVSRNIQNQIANAQKKLKDLSADDNLTPEEKMKKRQEIQQEIANLQQQLRQHQIEQKREQQSKDSSVEELTGSRKTGAAKSGAKGTGLSTSSMQAMISADSSMKQAKVQGSVSDKMEGRAGVLEAEIKLDRSRGGNTEAKEAELSEARSKAMEAENSQIGTLSEANRTLEEAAKEDRQTQANESDKKTEDRDEKTTQIARNEEGGENKETSQTVENSQDANVTDAAEAAPQAVSYAHVDIRL